MITELYLTPIDGLYVLILSIFIGIEVIKNVPAILHTPLMSGANAISGIILIGGTIQLLTVRPTDIIPFSLASLAVLIGTINVAGGFFVTNRMLSLFKVRNNNK